MAIVRSPIIRRPEAKKKCPSHEAILINSVNDSIIAQLADHSGPACHGHRQWNRFLFPFLARKIASEERQKVQQWVAASKAVVNNPCMDLALPNLIRNDQQSIPIIETNEHDSIINFINLDSAKAARIRTTCSGN